MCTPVLLRSEQNLCVCIVYLFELIVRLNYLYHFMCVFAWVPLLTPVIFCCTVAVLVFFAFCCCCRCLAFLVVVVVAVAVVAFFSWLPWSPSPCFYFRAVNVVWLPFVVIAVIAVITFSFGCRGCSCRPWLSFPVVAVAVIAFSRCCRWHGCVSS